VAQIGRISGPLLEANLERKDLVKPDSQANLAFKNNSGDIPLLYLDVLTGKVGVNNSAPSAELNVTGTLNADFLISTSSQLGNISINENTITNLSSNPLTFTANNVDINSFSTSQIRINNQEITTYNTNTDLEFNTNGTGTMLFGSNVEVYAGISLDTIQGNSINASGNIQAGRYLFNGFTIDDNIITTAVSNADLELSANSSGKIIFENLSTDNNFTHNAAQVTFANIDINTINQTGDISITGNAGFNYVDRTGIHLDIPGDSILGNLSIEGNAIKQTVSDADVNINTAGTGEINLLNNVLVDGSLHATGDITLDGNIVFGDDSTVDTVAFNADFDTDVLPNQDIKYNLGVEGKTFSEVHTVLLNGQDIAAAVINIDGVDLGSGQGNIIYVAQGGDDINQGDHQQRPVRTIGRALEVAHTSSIPTQIYIFPGEYQEDFPLEVPVNTTVTGSDIRNTIVYPTTATYDNDAFWLNGETTVENLSVQNFYYNSTDNTGYAFRFAPNAFISSRSPYVRNITVITKGAQLSAADPRGFNSGDAGRGAYIDGADVLPTSEDASMLFHSVTFITPGVDAVTMTNGVRVEWLNSFTYFADRGLYAKNGTTGHLSTDGSTIKYGAEIRSIGSANVYGNYGVVAEGNDTLFYLIGHNMAYIGSGKAVTNDPTLTIQENETVELDNGKIYFTSTDALGNFRAGENFLVDFETGSTAFTIDTINLGNGNSVTITNGSDVTTITGTTIDQGILKFEGNTISTSSGPINLNAYDTNVNVLGNVNVANNTTVFQDISVQGSVITLGDTDVDQITFNADIEQDIIPGSDSGFNLGSDTNAWGNAYIGQFVGDSISINDNYITTTDTNVDLELRANGTGDIYVSSNDVQIDNNLTVVGDTDLQDLEIIDRQITFQQTTVQVEYGEAGFGTGTFIVDLSSELGTTDIQNINIASVDVRGDLGISSEYIDLRLVSSGSYDRYQGTADTAIYQNYSWLGDQPGSYIFTIEYRVPSAVNFSPSGMPDGYYWQVRLNIDCDTPVTTEAPATVTHTGDKSQTGDVNQTGDLTVTQDLNVNSASILNEISISNSVIKSIPVPDTNIITADLIYQNQPWWRIDDPGDFQWYITASALLIHEDTPNLDLTDIPNILIYDNSNNLVFAYGNYSLGTYSGPTIRLYSGDILYPQGITEADIDGLFTGFATYTLKYLSQGRDILNIDNSPMSLQANGTGEVLFNENTEVTNDLTINGDLNLVDINAEDITAQRMFLDNVELGSSQRPFEYYYAGGVYTNGLTTFWQLERRGSWTHTLSLWIDGVSVYSLSQFSTGAYSSYYTIDTLTNGSITWLRGALIDNPEDYYTATPTTNQRWWRWEIQQVDQTSANANGIIGTNNLELQASGTGEVVFEDLQADQDLTIAVDTTLQSTDINGVLTHVGNVNHTGDLTVTNLHITGNLDITQGVQLEEIRFDDNVITNTSTNADLEFRAHGTGRVIIDEELLAQNLTTTILTLDGINVNGVTGDNFELENIDLFDNVITTTITNSNLELRANGVGNVDFEDVRINTDNLFTDSADLQFNTSIATFNSTDSVTLPQGTTANWSLTEGSIRYNSDDNVFEGFGANIQTFDQLYSADRQTSVIANSTNNHLEFTVNNVQVGNIDLNSVNFHALQADSVLIDNNEITTVDTNADLELRTEETITQYVGELTANEPLTDTSLRNGKQTIAVNDEYIVIGDPSSNENGFLEGRVMVYTRQGEYQYTLYEPGNESISLFGGSVSLNENNILVAGAYNTPPSGRGSVVFYNVETQEQLLRVTGPTSSSNFGWTTAINNRYAFVSITGSSQFDNVRVYDLYQDPPQLVQTLTHPTSTDPFNSDSFGRTMAADENYLAVYSSDDGGQIFIFELENFTLIDTLNTPTYNAWYMYAMQIRKGKLYYAEEIAPLGSDDIQFVIYDIENQTILNQIPTIGQNTGLNNWHADDNYIYAADPNAGDDFVHAYNQTTGNLDYQVAVPTGENTDVNLFVYNNDLFVRTVNAIHRYRAPKILVNDLEIVNDFIKHYNTGAFEFTQTGIGYVKFDGTNGLVIPAGSTAGRGDNLQVGEMRWNTEREIMEIYSGTEWIIVAGGGESITAETFENLLFEFTMALG